MKIQTIYATVIKAVIEIEDLIAELPQDDPQFEAVIERLTKVKNVLEAVPVSIRQRSSSKTKKLDSSNDSQLVKHVDFEEPEELPQTTIKDFIGINLDDSLLHIVDEVISAYKIVRSLMRK